MKLTLKAALEMYQAVQALDQPYQNGAEKQERYKYDGETRLHLAIARRKLREIHEDYLEARNKLLMEVTQGSGDLPDVRGPWENGSDRVNAVRMHVTFNERERSMLKAPIELDIKPLPSKAFKLDENPIPVAVLDLLGDMLQMET